MDVKAWSRRAVTAAVLATFIALPALKPVAARDADDAAPGWGYGYGMGMGPGMMGGYGPGCSMMGGGYGGMGMMGMGSGMMGGMMGPGMMGGGYGMGPGMMGYGAYNGLNLTDQQRDKINKIFDDERRGHWAVMGKMMDEQNKLRDLYQSEQPDPKAVGTVYGAIAKLRQQMIETHVAAQNKVDQLLTKEQREQLQQWRRGGYGPGMMGPGYGPGYMMRGGPAPVTAPTQ